MFWGQEGGPVSPLPLPLPCPPSSFLLGHTPGVGSATSSRVGTPAAPLQRTCLEASIASPFCWGLVLSPLGMRVVLGGFTPLSGTQIEKGFLK